MAADWKKKKRKLYGHSFYPTEFSFLKLCGGPEFLIDREEGNLL